MNALHLVLDLQAAMSVAEMISPHREPTHPAVISHRFGNGQGLPHFALMAHATGPVLTLHHARITNLVAEEVQDMLQTRFAMHDSHVHPLDPTPLLLFVHLPIGPALGPT
jgi:hypothetical protein